jgi:hypothetical protein
MMLGKLLSEQMMKKENIQNFSEVEFKVFSQFGDDGIIQHLINKLDIQEKIFVEFGVETYEESNTKFLLLNNNWSGLVMDNSAEHIAFIKKQEYFWRYNLKVARAFITQDNINDLLSENKMRGNIGLLSIDIDGNDYWVWKNIGIVNPVIVIAEYNSVFGGDRAITIPYDEDFIRSKAHFSHLYWGASLKALCFLAGEKGYVFVGSNSAGNNAYFIRKDRIMDIKEIDVQTGYVESKFRDSRNNSGELSFVSGKNRLDLIKGLPVFNVELNKIEVL